MSARRKMIYRTNLYVKLQERDADLELLITYNAHPGVKASFDSPAEEPSIEIVEVGVLVDGSATKVADGGTPAWLLDLAQKSPQLTECLIEHAFEVWVADEDGRAEAAARRAQELSHV